MKLLTALLLILMNLSMQANGQESEFSFDANAFEPKAFQLTGSFDFKSGYGEANKEGALYQLQFIDIAPNTLEAYSGTLELSGHYRNERTSFNFLTNSEISHDIRGEEQEHDLYEAFLGFQRSPALNFELGKKSMRWGKGYAWNPVAFVERTKDAGSPDLAREGYWIAAMDSIYSFDDELKTLALTVLALPVDDDINSDFSESGHNYLAAKLYLFYKDTDLDFMFLSKGGRGPQIGMDFSRNLAPNFEIHGEFAYFENIPHRTVSSDCRSGPIDIDDEISYLLGLKYRTNNDITLIWEYYFNGRGNSKTEQQRFFQCVQDASEANDSDLLDQLPITEDIEKGPFSRPNPMQKYMTLRALWEEPGDLLYFSAGLQMLYNVEDRSYSISPEIIYEKFKNIELRVKTTFPQGDALTEWGEKPNKYKIETEFSYYF